MTVTLQAEVIDETGDCLTLRLKTGFGDQIVPVHRGSVKIEEPTVVMATYGVSDPT